MEEDIPCQPLTSALKHRGGESNSGCARVMRALSVVGFESLRATVSLFPLCSGRGQAGYQGQREEGPTRSHTPEKACPFVHS